MQTRQNGARFAVRAPTSVIRARRGGYRHQWRKIDLERQVHNPLGAYRCAWVHDVVVLGESVLLGEGVALDKVVLAEVCALGEQLRGGCGRETREASDKSASQRSLLVVHACFDVTSNQAETPQKETHSQQKGCVGRCGCVRRQYSSYQELQGVLDGQVVVQPVSDVLLVCGTTQGSDAPVG